MNETKNNEISTESKEYRNIVNNYNVGNITLVQATQQVRELEKKAIKKIK